MTWNPQHSPATPSDQPCHEVNPQLWQAFREQFKQRFGYRPRENSYFTEAFCAQWMDHEVTVDQ